MTKYCCTRHTIFHQMLTQSEVDLQVHLEQELANATTPAESQVFMRYQLAQLLSDKGELHKANTHLNKSV